MYTLSIKDKNTIKALNAYGLTSCKKIAKSLQGSIWSVEKSGNKYVVKVASKQLQKRSSIIHNGKEYTIEEDITKEACILKHLTAQKDAPDTIIKYIDFFESAHNYYLVMENGGNNLLDFVRKAHSLIKMRKLSINEWHKCVNVLLKQLLNAIHYIHSRGICNFDFSLENIVINDVDVQADTDGRNNTLKFCLESLKIKIIDFGLAEFHEKQVKSSKFVGKTNYKSPEVTSQKKPFDPFANDIWCVGVCFFMMIIGYGPFEQTSLNDNAFRYVINNQVMHLINSWGRINYVTVHILDLFSCIFQYETKRIGLKNLLTHPWLNYNLIC